MTTPEAVPGSVRIFVVAVALALWVAACGGATTASKTAAEQRTASASSRSTNAATTTAGSTATTPSRANVSFGPPLTACSQVPVLKLETILHLSNLTVGSPLGRVCPLVMLGDPTGVSVVNLTLSKPAPPTAFSVFVHTFRTKLASLVQVMRVLPAPCGRALYLREDTPALRGQSLTLFCGKYMYSVQVGLQHRQPFSTEQLMHVGLVLAGAR